MVSSSTPAGAPIAAPTTGAPTAAPAGAAPAAGAAGAAARARGPSDQAAAGAAAAGGSAATGRLGAARPAARGAAPAEPSLKLMWRTGSCPDLSAAEAGPAGAARGAGARRWIGARFMPFEPCSFSRRLGARCSRVGRGGIDARFSGFPAVSVMWNGDLPYLAHHVGGRPPPHLAHLRLRPTADPARYDPLMVSFEIETWPDEYFCCPNLSPLGSGCLWDQLGWSSVSHAVSRRCAVRR